MSVLAAALLVPAVANAQVNAKLTGLGGNLVQYGVYVGPYQGTVQGFAGTRDLICVDFYHHARVGMEWTAHLTVLADGADLSRTRFGMLTNAMDRYRQAAWLSEKFRLYTGNAVETGRIHAAIWDLFTPAAPGPDAPGAHWLTDARANYMDGSVNYASVGVLTDVNVDHNKVPGAGGVQEYLFVTPEPASLALLGIGLAGLSGAVRRRRKS